jgi:hypothetical protein
MHLWHRSEETLINMKVAILTTEQKDILDKQQFAPRWFFNPVQDANGDWVISEMEASSCNNPTFSWVGELELSDWLGAYIPPETV